MLVSFTAGKTPRKVSINPRYVVTVEESPDRQACDIITVNGHTWTVKGAYDDVHAKLNIKDNKGGE